jgi:hypothetical protein
MIGDQEEDGELPSLLHPLTVYPGVISNEMGQLPALGAKSMVDSGHCVADIGVDGSVHHPSPELVQSSEHVFEVLMCRVERSSGSCTPAIMVVEVMRG